MWRFVHDLRADNDCVIPMHPVVADPSTVLSSVPANTTYYTVIDLCSAFFSIPIHKDSQFLFAFTLNGNQYTWTRAPRGYTESPTLYSRALHHDLRDVQLPAGSVLVQYMDDLLVASPSKEACERDYVALLNMLEKKGHNASLTKLSFVSHK